ncbi:MFS transporter, CP family, cyanate transporter [Planococcus glaciei]|uniref:MFS transporter n=1 Tax=Planococcus glaciei TaxID=459472 RepID=UPI0008843CA5|nr:MFS transporter [Planococcus glaciei]SDI17270.1 MFS transporter, CP family, cyanate transporter [Planococcus glaciei]
MTAPSKKSVLGLMVLAIFFVSLNLRPAISSIGPLLETIRTDLALSNSQISLLTSVPVFCMGLFAPLAVGFNRKFGMKRSISILIIVIGTLTLVRGLVPSYPVLLASAFFIGLAIAIISPLLSAMIKRNFPTRTASLIGVYSFGMGLGAALSSGLTGVFYTILDWPLALASWGLLAIAALILWQRVEEPESDALEVRGEPVLSPWKNKRAWLMLLFFAFQSALFFSLITWLAPIASDKGMNILAAGAVLTVMSLVQLVGNLSIPALLGKFPSRLLWTFVLLISGAAGILLLMIEGTAFIWLAAVLLGITLGGLFPIALLMPLDENTRADDVNSWTAMIQSGGYIISSIMPFGIGFLYDRYGTHDITLNLLLGYILVLAVCALLLNKKGEGN